MFISDQIKSSKEFKPGYLNLITAGCGTGKMSASEINIIGSTTQKSVGIIWAVYI